VDLAEARADGVERRRKGVAVAEVEPHGERGVARGRDRLLEPLEPPAGDGDVRALARERERDRPAEAAAAADDERRLAVEAEVHEPTRSAAPRLRSRLTTERAVMRPVRGFSDGTFSIVIVRSATSDSTTIVCVLRVTVGSTQIS